MPVAKIDDGVELNYTISGRGGAGLARLNTATFMACSNEMFQGIMEQSRSLLTFDFRGTGKSSGPDSLDSYTAAAYTEDLHQLFGSAGIERSPIIGYSHGGFFALDFALQHPERCSALVLIEPALFFDRSKLQERIKVVLQNKEAGIKLLLQQIAPELARNRKAYNAMVQAISDRYPDAIGLAGEWQARITNEIGDDTLRDLKVPTLLITGERSRVRQYTARAGRLIPGAATWVIPGASHLVLDEKPSEVAAVVDLFLSQHAPGKDGAVSTPYRAAAKKKSSRKR